MIASAFYKVGATLNELVRLVGLVLAMLILGLAVVLSVPVILLGIFGLALLEAAS